jgi:diguanylate cyclase (GGDEF)-like protein
VRIVSSSIDNTKIESTVDIALDAIGRAGFAALNFLPPLEDRFEADTRKARSYRMWLEGLVAILGLNLCLILDYTLIHDLHWLAVVRHTVLVTPLALVTNFLVRRNPVGWVRESMVAFAMVAICLMDLVAEGNFTTLSTLFGEICVLITALFVGVVMRLRFPYALAAISAMLVAGLWFLWHGNGIRMAEVVIGGSLMFIGLGLILVASYSLEREERRSYLLCLKRDLQAAELAEINTTLQQLSSQDALTKLPNRRTFEEKFEQMWTTCEQSGSRISAVVVDVDHFKRVNDVYGHLYGDETLQRIGALLPKALRSEHDMAARFGGEEFILLLPYSEPGNAMIVAERARQLVEAAGTPLAPISSREPVLWITVSCGVSSCIPGPGITYLDLIAAADEALYAAKRNGRNCVEFVDCKNQRPWREPRAEVVPFPASKVIHRVEKLAPR